MISRMKCCIKKDLIEALRTGKVTLFALLAFGIGVLIMLFTVVFSDIPDSLMAELPGLDISSLEDMMSVLYPKRVRESVGVFGYYIGFFYSLITILVCNSMLPKERKNGKWILPVQQGYEGRDFITGKCLVYGGLAGLSVFASMLVYYLVASTFMMRNMNFGNGLVLALVHGLNIFFILAFTILLSIWFGNGTVAAISMIGTVLFVPDIMRYLTIGRYLPTYMLTFVYDGMDTYSELVLPLILNIILLALTYIFAVRKVEKNKNIL